jgi:hypothetical protein
MARWRMRVRAWLVSASCMAACLLAHQPEHEHQREGRERDGEVGRDREHGAILRAGRLKA